MKITATCSVCLILAALVVGCGTSPFGFGLPENYDGLTKSDIAAKLPSNSFVLIDATSNMPAAWPVNIRQITFGESIRYGKIRLLTWWMSMDGKKWQRFYSFALDVYLDENKLEPAMIYERKPINDAIAYVPVMRLFFNPSGHATKCSKTWCNVVRKEAIKNKN